MSKYLTYDDLIKNRNWNKDLIPIYLPSEGKDIRKGIIFEYQKVVKVENYLKNVAKIDFKVKK